MFKALIGDMFASGAQTLTNTVNCVGVMGKGVALEFKKRFPRMAKDYEARCARGEVRLGEQAEEVATIIYACRWIKARRQGAAITEQDILTYVMDWKPSWQSEEKREAVAGAIRNLVLLNWVKAEISETMIDAV